MKVYISYSWDEVGNLDWVQKLKNDLEDENLKVIYDRAEIDNGGRDIHKFIEDGMTEADYIIIVITPSYIEKANRKSNKNENRAWVEIENDYTRRRRHNNYESSLLPIILKKDSRAKLPYTLEGLSYYDMSNKELYNVELKRLKKLLCNKENDTEEYYLQRSKNNTMVKLECDINFNMNIAGIPTKVSTEIIYNNAKFILDHTQTINLMLKYYNVEFNDNYMKGNSYNLITDYFNIELSYEQYKEIINKIKQKTQNYVDKIEKFEADFEVSEFKLLNNDFCYELFKIDKKYWKILIDIANKYDWDNGKTQWHIFQRNNNCVHVYAPINFHNANLNSGQHALFKAVKDDSMNYDYVKIYVSAIDIINSNYDGYTISKRDAWGVRTAYKWFKNDFIPFVCRNKNLEEEEILPSNNSPDSKENIFSEMQSFYMSYRVSVSFDEIIQLRNILCYCLSKEFPSNDYDYITKKIGILDIDLSKSPQIVSERIQEKLNSDEFIKKIDKHDMNASLADDLLRCVKVFTNDFSNYKLRGYDIEYIKKLSASLIKKMQDIKLLEKYKNN